MTTFLGTSCYAWIIPAVQISNYDPTSPTGTTTKTINLQPDKKYNVVYYDQETGEVSQMTGVFKQAIIRADVLSSNMVDLTTSGCPNLIESLIFDYSRCNNGRIKLLDVTSIRDITEYVINVNP